MNSPREKAVTIAILREAKRHAPDLLVRKLHGSIFATAGDPDLYGSYKGRAFAIEVKRPGEKATPLQEARLRDWAAAGAITGTVHSAGEFFALLVGKANT